MNASLLLEVEREAEACLPKAIPLDTYNPVIFFSKHLHQIARLIKERENLGNCRYELQFEAEVVNEWPQVIEATLKKMGYSVILSVNQWNLAVFHIRWQAIEPAV